LRDCNKLSAAEESVGQEDARDRGTGSAKRFYVQGIFYTAERRSVSMVGMGRDGRDERGVERAAVELGSRVDVDEEEG
jgi:hypothetical protein